MSDIITYSYPEARGIVVCGDIHGEFNTLIYKLCIQYGMTDTRCHIGTTDTSTRAGIPESTASDNPQTTEKTLPLRRTLRRKLSVF